MGTRFRYVSDAALRPEDADYYTHCQVCDRKDVVYPFQQQVRSPGGDVDDANAVCERCLRLGFEVVWDDDFIDIVRNYFSARPPAGDALRLVGESLARLRHSPQPGYGFQRFDWPLCCGDFCEFIGHPEGTDDNAKLAEGATYWDQHPRQSFEGRNLVEDGPPEDWGEVSYYACIKCRKKYFLDNYT
jgi:uncharacterized protein CbrC (UPF0167 family)